tara:strand:+ start:551 stop:937 length:387 start_codon:yes stop_codon:yes gene_type:complete
MEAEIATNGDGVEEEVTNASQLPEPCGWKLLIAIPEVEDKTEGGIIKSTEAMQEEGLSTVVGFVMKLGPLAYRDIVRFPTGPWCQEGNFILMRAYSGTRIKIHGKEFRLINDDTVEAVVDDPRGIAKV